jgi:4-amino-4-deoxy-L-arabinose transferase-like glycosyltransferase
MLRSGDLVVPTLNGLPFFHKPPLTYWIDVAAMSIFGIHPLAARVGPALGGWLMGAAMYLWLRRRHGPRTAAWALAALASGPLFFGASQFVSPDMMVSGCITVAVLAFARAVEDESAPSLGWLVGAWCACALGVLAKGLIGVVLPLLVIGPWLLAQRRIRRALWLGHPAAVGAGVLVGLPWFLLAQRRYPGFFDYFFMDQHFRRFTATSFNNVRPFWFFLVGLPLLTLPWSLSIPRALHLAWSRRSVEWALYAWWVVVIVGFFSLPASKMIGYVLPALAPWLALAVLSHGELTNRVRARLRVAILVTAVLSLAAVGAIAYKSPNSHRRAARALAAALAPGDRVAVVGDMFFDVPFEANLKTPVIVLSHWSDPEQPNRDDWRKLLLDAARFDPAAASRTLWSMDRAGELLCGPGRAWYVIKKNYRAPARGLPGVQPVYSDEGVELLRGDGRPCPSKGDAPGTS